MIVTHKNPDLDCILAVWFLKRFGGMSNSRVEFIGFGDPIPPRLEDATFADIGKGEFDHHHRSDYVSAATLVLDKLNIKDNKVLYKLADIARKIDHGQFDEDTKGVLNLVNIIPGLNKKYPDQPHKVLEICFDCLDSIYLVEKEKYSFNEQINNAKKFNTIWGRGIALKTTTRSIRFFCHKKGYIVFIYLNPKNNYRGFAAPGGKNVDFTNIYQIVKEREPKAEWHLHFTKDLLICGSNKAANKVLSKITLEEMIELVRI